MRYQQSNKSYCYKNKNQNWEKCTSQVAVETRTRNKSVPNSKYDEKLYFTEHNEKMQA